MTKSLGLAMFLINFPFAIRALLRRQSVRDSWVTSYSAIWLVTIAVVPALGRLVPVTGMSPFPLIMLAGALSLVVSIVTWFRSVSWKSILGLVVGAGIFSSWAAGVVWGRIYKSPLFLEMLIADGKVHHDGVTLAAIANMIRTYHVSSPGLDGVPYLAYHWGTQWIFAQWANLVGLNLTELYNLVFPVTVIPIFYGAIVVFALEVRTALNRSTPTTGSAMGAAFWIVFLSATVGFMPISGMEAIGVWTSNVLISESYTFAIPVALLFASLVITFWQERRGGVMSGDASMMDYLFVAIVLPAGIVTLGYLKISLMILAYIGVLFTALRVRAYRRLPLVAVAIVTTIFVALAFKQVSLVAHREGVVPLDFLKDYVPIKWWPFFPLLHVFWSVVYVGLRLHHLKARTLGDLVGLVRMRQILDVELVAVIAVLGLGPGLLLHINGGSAFYFSDVQRWLALALLLAGAPMLLPRLGSWRWTDLRTIAIAFIALPLAISMARNSYYWTSRMLRSNSATRRTLYMSADGTVMPEGINALRLLRDPVKLQRGLENSRNYNPVMALLALDDLPLREKRRTAVFVPQSETRYWTILQRPGACMFSGFPVPSFTGMTMVDGMPPVGCELIPYYGLSRYPLRTAPQTVADTRRDALCARAGKLGFDRVLTLKFDENGRMSREPIECRKV
ncbi:MAG: hypothetical protein ABIS03_01695 [Gemmatimonadaceae bacterium]